jgi:Mor family transcriptional regulator
MSSVSLRVERLVLEKYAKGASAQQIQEKTGLGRCTIYRILKRNSQATRRDFSRVGQNHRLFDDETEQKIAQEYIDGGAFKGLAKKYGCNFVTIRNVLKRQNVKSRRRGGLFRRLITEDKEKLMSMWNAGKSQSFIAKELGASQTVISRAILECGGEPEIRRPRGSEHGSWNGGKVHWAQGYIGILVQPDDPYYSMATSSGYILEHRLAMARHLGRALRKTEMVHHINGDKSDNRIENLQLVHAGHGRGEAFCCFDCGSRNVGPMELEKE